MLFLLQTLYMVWPWVTQGQTYFHIDQLDTLYKRPLICMDQEIHPGSAGQGLCRSNDTGLPCQAGQGFIGFFTKNAISCFEITWFFLILSVNMPISHRPYVRLCSYLVTISSTLNAHFWYLGSNVTWGHRGHVGVTWGQKGHFHQKCYFSFRLHGIWVYIDQLDTHAYTSA